VEGIFESCVDVEFFSKVDIDEFLNYFNRLEKSYLGLLEKKWRGGILFIQESFFYLSKKTHHN
jgi:hypothetical protein